MRIILAFLRDARGATSIEYALIASLISIGLLVSVGGFANGFENTYMNIANKMK